MKLSVLLILAALLAVSLVVMSPRLCFAAGSEPLVQSYGSSEAKIGDVVVCPVMGGTFTVSAVTQAVTIMNKKYYVCCSSCVEKLSKEPDKYLKGDKVSVK